MASMRLQWVAAQDSLRSRLVTTRIEPHVLGYFGYSHLEKKGGAIGQALSSSSDGRVHACIKRVPETGLPSFDFELRAFGTRRWRRFIFAGAGTICPPVKGKKKTMLFSAQLVGWTMGRDAYSLFSEWCLLPLGFKKRARPKQHSTFSS